MRSGEERPIRYKTGLEVPAFMESQHGGTDGICMIATIKLHESPSPDQSHPIRPLLLFPILM